MFGANGALHCLEGAGKVAGVTGECVHCFLSPALLFSL
jgi:hypothetical protein